MIRSFLSALCAAPLVFAFGFYILRSAIQLLDKEEIAKLKRLPLHLFLGTMILTLFCGPIAYFANFDFLSLYFTYIIPMIIYTLLYINANKFPGFLRDRLLLALVFILPSFLLLIAGLAIILSAFALD